MLDVPRLINLRAQKDEFFKAHPQSPLSAAQKARFSHLDYFPPMPRLAYEVTLVPHDEQPDVPIQTTTGETRWYRRYGWFAFAVDGQDARLTIYQTPHGFFLPFVDGLAGQETYPAGRYLEPIELGEGRFLIDFNEAYNPYCAYSPHYSCPITPAENRLSVAIRAGEKLPQGDWVDAE